MSEIDKYEDYVIRKVADLIYVTHSDFIKSKLKVKNSISLRINFLKITKLVNHFTIINNILSILNISLSNEQIAVSIISSSYANNEDLKSSSSARYKA